ncbi:hypothetical protein MAFF301560_44640 (plasmid) [Ralstonia solanacearum]|nr:hypothetical protein [Ralstonia solanacearum]BCM05077.1 hypothetical protein MAFF301560_44640 [Ralstonia solanacearum]BEU49138.1 hypothetical protein MAFF211519_44630 [Ralstonia pseudosolanacearum]
MTRVVCDGTVFESTDCFRSTIVILIWQGLGFLAVLIPLCVSLVGQLAADALLGKGYYTAHHSVFATLMVLSAAAIWHLGKVLNSRPGRVLVDPKTGQQVELKARHTLFWIPLQWTALLVVAFGVSSLFQ